MEKVDTKSVVDNEFKSWFMVVLGYFYLGQGYSLASMVLLLPLYIRSELGVGNYSRSVMFSAIIIFPWYIKLVFGFITDNYPIGRYGRRKPYLIIATLFSIIGWLTIGIHNSANFLFVISGVSLALGSALADSVVDGQTVELTPKTHISRIQGIAWGSRGLGIGLTGIASALIIDIHGWQTMFYVNSIFGISISIVALLLPQTHSSNQVSKGVSLIRNTFTQVFSTNNSRKKMVFFFLSGASLSIVPLLPIIMEKEFDYSIKMIGYGALVFAIGSFLGAVVNGILFDKIENKRRIVTLFYSFAGSLLLSLLLIWIDKTELQFIYFFIVGITAGSFEGYQLKIIQESTSKSVESSGFATFTSISNIGQFALGGLTIVYLSELLNVPIFVPLQISTIIIILSLFIILKIKNQNDSK